MDNYDKVMELYYQFHDLCESMNDNDGTNIDKDYAMAIDIINQINDMTNIEFDYYTSCGLAMSVRTDSFPEYILNKYFDKIYSSIEASVV